MQRNIEVLSAKNADVHAKYSRAILDIEKFNEEKHSLQLELENAHAEKRQLIEERDSAWSKCRELKEQVNCLLLYSL